jgi:hypothetical protein
VPASVVSAGRLMRCAKCRSDWMPLAPPEYSMPPAEATHPEPAPAPERERVDAQSAGQLEDDQVLAPTQRAPIPGHAALLAAEPVIRAPFPALPPAHQPVRRAVVAGWVASVLVLVIALWLAIAFRQAVIQHWPASERAYAVLGFR